MENPLKDSGELLTIPSQVTQENCSIEKNLDSQMQTCHVKTSQCSNSEEVCKDILLSILASVTDSPNQQTTNTNSFKNDISKENQSLGDTNVPSLNSSGLKSFTMKTENVPHKDAEQEMRTVTMRNSCEIKNKESDLQEKKLNVIENTHVNPMFCQRSVPDLQDSGTEADNSSDSSSVFSADEVSDHDQCEQIQHDQNEADRINVEVMKTKGELFPEDLLPISELKITIADDEKLLILGTVSSVVGLLVVIQSAPNTPALNEETVLFNENRSVFGTVFEIFGPVACPFYSVRFNSADHIKSQNISVGDSVYCAPNVDELTQYIFVDQLKQMKGSDASWKDNNEPPEKYIDFSDDEKERQFKAKKRERNSEKTDGKASEIVDSEKSDNFRNRKPRQRNKRRDGNRAGQGTYHSEGNNNSFDQCWPPHAAGPPRHYTPRFQNNSNPFMMTPHIDTHGTRMNIWPPQPMNFPSNNNPYNFSPRGRTGHPRQYFPSSHQAGQVNPMRYNPVPNNSYNMPRPVIMDSRFVQNPQSDGH